MSRTRRFYYWLHRQWNAWRGSRACPVCGRPYTDKTAGFVVYRDRRMEEVCQPCMVLYHEKNGAPPFGAAVR